METSNLQATGISFGFVNPKYFLYTTDHIYLDEDLGQPLQEQQQ